MGRYTAFLTGRLCNSSFFQATQKRRVVVVLVKAAATSGMALRRAAVSSLEAVTVFQLTVYSPAWSSSEEPIMP